MNNKVESISHRVNGHSTLEPGGYACHPICETYYLLCVLLPMFFPSFFFLFLGIPLPQPFPTSVHHCPGCIAVLFVVRFSLASLTLLESYYTMYLFVRPLGYPRLKNKNGLL
eukprot:gene3896-2765_t